jgi:acyl-CoA thioesterase I
VAYGAFAAASNFALGVLVAAPAHAETVIAALGDSLVQGYGLPREEGFVPRLEAWLRDRGADVRLVNAGVSGDTSAGGLSRVDWTLTDEVDAMIVSLGGNDLLRGIDPAETRANIDAILDAAASRQVETLIVGMSAPGNYGPEHKAKFDALYPALAEEHGAVLAPGFHDILLSKGRQTALDRYMQPDGLHPNADGVAVIVEALGPDVLELIGRAAE